MSLSGKTSRSNLRALRAGMLLSVMLIASLNPAAGIEKNTHNWNQFRGPNGDGKTLATNLPVQFSETKNVRWKVPIHDEGWSSPVVWGNQI